MTDAYIVTGPTSGIGLCTALELAKRGVVVLVGRDSGRLAVTRERIEQMGGHAHTVLCDLANLPSVRQAAARIEALRLPISALVNNAGVLQSRPSRTAAGWDVTFATNYLGPFALTEALIPHLPDGGRVLFVVSAIEDPERRPAKVMGIRGGRFISVEASTRGEWAPGGSKMPGMDAYATSKQCALAAALALAREAPRLRVEAVEPGINPTTGLGGANAFLRFLFGQIITRLPPFAPYRSTPENAARVMAQIVADTSGRTGVYYDEKGDPMTGSSVAHDPVFQERLVRETRSFLARAET